MLKLSAVVHPRKKGTYPGVERFISHHPYLGMFLCFVIMPISILVAVGGAFYAIMFPLSFLMGWL